MRVRTTASPAATHSKTATVIFNSARGCFPSLMLEDFHAGNREQVLVGGAKLTGLAPWPQSAFTFRRLPFRPCAKCNPQPPSVHMARHKSHDQLRAVREKLKLDRLHPIPRKLVVGIVGGLCVLAGIVMIFTPGPALVFIPLGILLLATEFPW